MKEMNTLSAYDRATILEKVAQKWMKEEKNLQKLLQKRLQNQYVLQGEVDRTVQTYKFAAEEAKRIYGEHCHLMRHWCRWAYCIHNTKTDWGYRSYYTI